MYQQLSFPPPPPPRPQQPYPRLRRFFKSKLGIGCLVVVFGFLVCTIAVTAIASNSSNNGTAGSLTPTTTHQAVAQLAATSKPTERPTPKPTKRPTMKPTQAPKATPRPTQPPPKPTPCPGINCNPWGYNFSSGKLIYNPPANFCSYFNCIPSFWGSDDPGDGFVNQCVDGTYSQSGGERGDCSDHGGEGRPLYSH